MNFKWSPLEKKTGDEQLEQPSNNILLVRPASAMATVYLRSETMPDKIQVYSVDSRVVPGH